MKLPSDSADLIRFTRELIEQCSVSQEARRHQGRMWKQLFYTGTINYRPSKNNRCFSHVDKLASYLFSPSEVRFTLEFDGDDDEKWRAKGERATRHLNKRFNKSKSGLAFGEGNEEALIKGCAIIKMIWTSKGLQPWVIPPEFFGVLREDIKELDRQEAFTHCYYLTRDAFRRLLISHPDRDEIMQKVQGSFAVRSSEAFNGDSYFHEMVLGGNAPMNVGTAASGAMGAVSLTAAPTPMIGAEIAAELIRVDDLWVWNDEMNDWTTIRYVDPGLIIEGKYKRRNLSDAPGRHPFIKVCSNEVRNYFWGRSELAAVVDNQMVLNGTVDSVDSIFKLRAKPPRSFTGMGITDEKARALLAPGGILTDSTPGGKVQSEAPDMPEESLAWINKLEDFFDESAGFTPILSGEGDPGVRAGVHAGTLLRTSTPRLRDRALLVENQCAELGELCFIIEQAKNARVFKVGDEEFLLSQITDAEVTVDSHSSSPAFSEDNKQLMFALAKAGAIDGISLLEGVNPDRVDVLIQRLKTRMAAEAAAAAANPKPPEKPKR